MKLPRLLLILAFAATAAGPAATDPAAPARGVTIPTGQVLPAALGQGFLRETEANNTSGTANVVPAGTPVIQGDIFPAADVDYYTFQATAGDRLYAATMTSFSASNNRDSLLEVLAADGTTVIEADDNDGHFGSTASSLAGVILASTGTYYLRVSANGSETLRPYHLHVRLQSGSPTPEVEPNGSPGTATPLPPSGWVAGTINLVADTDYFVLTVPAGATIFASLDLYPSRVGPQWNGRVGLGQFDGYVLVTGDDGSGDSIDSEAIFMTVETAGQYYVFVDSNGTGTGTYHLSVDVIPSAAEGAFCQTYTTANAPQVIPAGPSVITSTLHIPDYFILADLDVSLTLTHTRLADVDAVLVSPAGNRNALFTDVGPSAPNPGTHLNLRLDDEAAVPINSYSIMQTMALQPEPEFRLSWFDGESTADGDWQLVLYDDQAGEGGRLTTWSLTACAIPFTILACPEGSVASPAFTSDFSNGADGFTHAGSHDEWELGDPSYAPLDDCFDDSACWATDLNGTYDALSNQNLFSPIVSLAGYHTSAWVLWAMKYQLESATFDRAHVDLVDSNVHLRRLWEWRDATMQVSVGSPPATLAESSGWGFYIVDITEFLGEDIGLTFNLQSDSTVQMAGLAIDNVTVLACKTWPVYLPQTTK